tara:strand:- start:1113 stop:1325 length:213 start_codon:yes stop_codon:yes gene_type:complete
MLVVLRVFSLPAEAYLARSILVEEGIEATVFDEGMSSLYPGVEALGYRMMVDEKDFEHAEKILSKAKLTP